MQNPYLFNIVKLSHLLSYPSILFESLSIDHLKKSIISDTKNGERNGRSLSTESQRKDQST